jgi:DNA-binding XRE family transcriptional regulator
MSREQLLLDEIRSLPNHKRLFVVREALGLSRPAAAGRVGVSRQTIWELEEGKRAPGLEVAKALEAIFGVPYTGWSVAA